MNAWSSGRRTDATPPHFRDPPPVEVYIGDRDILRPAVDAFARRAADDGAALRVHEVSAMFHVWMTRAIPEGRRTRRDLARLVLRTARAAAQEDRA